MEGSLALLSTTTLLIVPSVLLAIYYPTSVALDRPVHATVIALSVCALTLYCFTKYSSYRIFAKLSHHGAYHTLPSDEISGIGIIEEKSEIRQQTEPLDKPKLLLVILGSTLALILRIEVFRRVSRSTECSFRSAEVFIPLLLAVYNALRIQKSLAITRDSDVASTAYEDFATSFKSIVLGSAWRYVPSAALVSVGGYLITSSWDSLQSTYVCPLLHGQEMTIPRLQLAGLLLDTLLGIGAQELALGSVKQTHPLFVGSMPWVVIMTVASATWTFIGIIVYVVQPEDRAWITLSDLPSDSHHFVAMVWLAILFSVICIIFLFSYSQHGFLQPTLLLASVFTVIPGAYFVWSHRRPSPPLSSAALTWSFVLVYLGWSWFRRVRKAITDPTAESSSFWRITRLLLLFAILIPGLFKKDSVHFHPIDLLMYDAQSYFIKYVQRATSSKTLDQAVKSYVHYYSDNPPPGFDIWFQFARNRSVLITDEFDQIYHDLLPFRAVSPSTLREHTWDILANPWNEIAGIKIRNGTAELQENVLPTHRWMVEGAASIISSFSQYLPDMDLAFNLNDESRIALEYNEMAILRSSAQKQTFRGSLAFSKNRASGWVAMPDLPTEDTIFENWSFRNTFREWAIRGCSASSKAHRESQTSSKSTLCTSCAAPHSLGQFVSNWSLAADPCHQPDLEHLHGFYLSPAAFKTSRQLRPVFSQSKAHGYNDILYPSPWNYMDKVAYAPSNGSVAEEPDQIRSSYPDPPFSEKENSLFWRGATSEGVSPGTGTWRGMARQRLIHMANNSTSNPHDQVTILLLDNKHPQKYTYRSLSGNAPRNLGLSTNMRFVDHVGRCGGRDCDDQAIEFGLVQPEDFQAHWKYRYLFDLDGAGFSGRFLPFLQSRSLPFKTALFREWYDSRLIPWLHFVPQDLRLHGVWSTLAYFAGVDGHDDRGHKVTWKPHIKEAEMIAETGREWAAKALSKADMEVYFFRLLLEWARLTDDNRDQLGYVMPK